MKNFMPIKEKDFMIREFSFSDFSDLQKIAEQINLTALKKPGYFPFYAFQNKTVDNVDLPYKVMAFLQKAEREKNTHPRKTYRMALCKKNGHLIGNITFDMIPSFSSDGEKIYGDLGYFIHPDEGEKGLMTRALRAALPYYFSKFNQMDVTVHPQNMYSRRMIERLGGQCVGHIQQSGYSSEPRAVYVIHRDDFFQDSPTRIQRQKICLAMPTCQNQR